MIIYLGFKIGIYLEAAAQTNYNVMPIVIYDIIFPIMIGLLVRLPKFIMDVKENISFTFDWVKFSVVAIPTLFVLITFFLSFSGYIIAPYFIIIGSVRLVTICGFILGYIILDSFKPYQTQYSTI